jgi:TRAP-type C4-dicarboxylate transport system substrate-binding protein
MKKRILNIILILIVAFATIGLSGTVVSASPLKILLAGFEPEQTAWSQVMKVWGNGLEKATNGKVKVSYNLGGGLVKPGESYDLVKKGIVDGAYCVLAFGAPGQFPMIDAIALPYCVPSAVIGGKAMQAYYEKGYLDKELEGVQPICFLTGQGDALFTKDKPVTTLADMKGLKIMAGSPIGQERVKLWGGVPVSMPFTEIYMGLKKGIIDGIIHNSNQLATFGLSDLLRYRTLPQEGTMGIVFMMNQNAFNKLPPEGKAFAKETSSEYAEMFNRGWDKQCQYGMKLFFEKGGKEVTWTPEAKKQRDQMEDHLWENYIAKLEKKGLPGRQAIDDLYNILKELGVNPAASGYRPK